jgi:hypothetical protein
VIRQIPRLVAVAAVGLAALVAPAVVAAHGLDTTYQSRLPLAVYLAGAAGAVALSFAFVLLRDLRAAAPSSSVAWLPPAWLRGVLRAVGLIAWLWIVAQGVIGTSSDANVGELFLWVYGWVGLTLVSAFVGPAWHWLDPFSTLHDLGAAGLRAVGVRAWDRAAYPAWLGRWPAVAGFAFFVWLELVLAGGIGRTLFVVVVGYTAFTLAMMAQFGRDEWRSHGETFTVWFRLLGRLAPYALADEAGRVRRRSFASGLLEGGWSKADVVLVALGVGSILFDGLSQTTPWYEVFGFPGAPIHTLQLFGFLALIAGAALTVVRFVGLASTGAGLLPIAVGYLIAHYLTYLLISGQWIVVAISDPFQQGWDLFGTAFHVPSGDFLAPGLVWTLQLASVVGGHMLGAWGGHVAAANVAAEERGDGEGRVAGEPAATRALRLRQVPLAVVMVALTTITLWSLGQAIVVNVDEAAVEAAVEAAMAGSPVAWSPVASGR